MSVFKFKLIFVQTLKLFLNSIAVVLGKIKSLPTEVHWIHNVAARPPTSPTHVPIYWIWWWGWQNWKFLNAWPEHALSSRIDFCNFPFNLLPLELTKASPRSSSATARLPVRCRRHQQSISIKIIYALLLRFSPTKEYTIKWKNTLPLWIAQ